MGDAVAAAREDEASQQKLASALRANVPAWDGNTAAIEEVLSARMKLGFSDDEQRDSLAHLVAATHDSSKALDIQRTAMDLARFKGISLADATDALTKVEAGSFRVLKSLGIELKAGATQTEALAAVQALAAGQAEDYANTNEGKLLASQVKLNEAMETLGYVIMPAVTDVMVGLSDIAVEASKHLGLFADAAGFVGRGLGVITAPVDLLAHAIGDLTGTSEKAATGLDRFAGKAKDDIYVASKAVGIGAGRIDGSLNDIGDQAHDTRAEFNKLTGAVNTAAAALAGAVYGPAQLKGEIAKLNDTLIADVKHLHDLEKIKNPTAATRRDITETKGRIAETNASLLKTKVDLATLNGAGLGALRGQLEKLARQTGAAGDEARALLAALLAVRLAQIGKMPSGGGGAKRRAGGGPVTAGETYLVGEKGPELFTPGTSGGITSNSGLSSGSSGAQITVVIDGEAVRTRILDSLRYSRGSGTFIPA